MKNSGDTIGNETRDLPACSALPQPTMLEESSQATLKMEAGRFFKIYLCSLTSKKTGIFIFIIAVRTSILRSETNLWTGCTLIFH